MFTGLFKCENVQVAKMPVKLIGKPFIRGIARKNNDEKLSIFYAFFNVFYMIFDVFIIKNTVNKPFGE